MEERIRELEQRVAQLEQERARFPQLLQAMLRQSVESTARTLVQQFVAVELISRHPQKKQIAEVLRLSAEQEVQRISDQPAAADYESAIALALNAMLEAAGEAPPRSIP